MSEAEPDIDDVDAGLRESLSADSAALRHALAATGPNIPNSHVRTPPRITRPVALTPRATVRREDEAQQAA